MVHKFKKGQVVLVTLTDDMVQELSYTLDNEYLESIKELEFVILEVSDNPFEPQPVVMYCESKPENGPLFMTLDGRVTRDGGEVLATARYLREYRSVKGQKEEWN